MRDFRGSRSRRYLKALRPMPVMEAATTSVGTAAALFEPDVLLPSQYLDRFRKDPPAQPEKRLQLAVLEAGVNDFLRTVGVRSREGRRLHSEAERWLQDVDYDWPFSFESICEHLGIDAGWFRKGLLALAQRRMAAA